MYYGSGTCRCCCKGAKQMLQVHSLGGSTFQSEMTLWLTPSIDAHLLEEQLCQVKSTHANVCSNIVSTMIGYYSNSYASCCVCYSSWLCQLTTMLHQLHCYLVQKLVDFKTATSCSTVSLLSSMAPDYLAADCQLSSEEGHR